MRVETSCEYLPSIDDMGVVLVLVFNTEEFIQYMKTQPTRYYAWCPHPIEYSEEFVRSDPDAEWTIVVHPDYDDSFANWEASWSEPYENSWKSDYPEYQFLWEIK